VTVPADEIYWRRAIGRQLYGAC